MARNHHPEAPVKSCSKPKAQPKPAMPAKKAPAPKPAGRWSVVKKP